MIMKLAVIISLSRIKIFQTCSDGMQKSDIWLGYMFCFWLQRFIANTHSSYEFYRVKYGDFPQLDNI